MTTFRDSAISTLYKTLIFLSALIFIGCSETSLSGSSADSLTLPTQALRTTPPVKQSTSGICHDESSASYTRTKNFIPYASLADCIDAGGRLPKGQTQQIDNATQEAEEQGRYFVSLYDRSDWPHWLDSDSDCQNTRHEILIQTSTKPITFKTDNACNVLTGEWYDPYSGETFTNSTDLDLDHIIPLKFAHGHGGDKWTRERKAKFANDLDNLILVSASLNRQKGAKGPDEWLPPNYPYRCEYIAHFDNVMTKYGLRYIPSEQRIINKMVQACTQK
jgi:5-methylcytosine-specific restriction endonuclease McrA